MLLSGFVSEKACLGVPAHGLNQLLWEDKHINVSSPRFATNHCAGC